MSRLRGPDEGFTLVELIVYSVILLIVMGIAATLFIRTLTAQRDTIAIAEANNLAQVTFKEIEADLRNAITAEIAADGDLLVLKTRIATASDTDSWRCIGYYLSGGTGELRRNMSTSGAETIAALDAAAAGTTGSATSDWTIVRDGFSTGGAARAFGTTDGIVQVSRLVRMTLSVDTQNEHKPVTFTQNVALRPQTTTDPLACN